MMGIRWLTPVFTAMLLLDAVAAQCSAIRYAITHGDAARVRNILKAEPKAVMEMNQYDFLRQSPLHLAIMRGQSEIAKILIRHGADVDAKDRDGCTPLHRCRSRRDLAELLIAKGADINAKDRQGNTPLHHTVMEKRPGPGKSVQGLVDTARLLIAKHANVNAKDDVGYTPMHKAATTGHTEIARLLISNGANFNAGNKVGRTPLHLAAQYGHKDIVELLIAARANINPRLDDWWAKRTVGVRTKKTPLGIAANQEIANILRRHGGIE